MVGSTSIEMSIPHSYSTFQKPWACLSCTVLAQISFVSDGRTDISAVFVIVVEELLRSVSPKNTFAGKNKFRTYSTFLLC